MVLCDLSYCFFIFSATFCFRFSLGFVLKLAWFNECLTGLVIAGLTGSPWIHNLNTSLVIIIGLGHFSLQGSFSMSPNMFVVSPGHV